MEPFLTLQASADSYDEMVTGDGQIRPHWQPLLSAFTGIDEQELKDRARRIGEHMSRDGVTYQVYGDDRREERPWRLDLLPLILPAAEWRTLEAGLIQRARLLNAALSDLYGERRLLRDGLIPPPLVFANHRFLRPAVLNAEARSLAPGAPPLSCYAVDLVRGQDGIWRVLSDRSEAPSGPGYALGNRRISTRSLPEAFRATGVRRQRDFFEAWQASLQALTRGEDRLSRIVMLGQANDDAHYEHIYLAREFGVPLVESDDLTVRNGRVYLKTLNGLQPVDVILRRMDGEECDPLELQSQTDAAGGVVGLLDAARRGRVTVLNAIGSAVLETPAWSPLLPGLAQQLLGEELLLPSIETWWGGQPDGQAAMLDGFDDLIVTEAFPPIRRRHRRARDVSALSREARNRLRMAIENRPSTFVARRPLDYSVAPYWSPSGLVPSPLILRAFLIWHDGSYRVMPGGLARLPDDPSPFFASLHRSGISKDVWIVADQTKDVAIPASALPTEPAAPLKPLIDTKSSTADSLFWFGRYLERFDNGARLTRMALYRLTLGSLDLSEQAELGKLVAGMASAGLIDPAIAGAPADGRIVQVALQGTGAPESPLDRLLDDIKGLADRVRERLSSDMWRGVTALVQDGRAAQHRAGADADRLLAAFDQSIRFSAAVSGLIHENMVRVSGWSFLELGRRIERVQHLTAQLANIYALPRKQWNIAHALALELCDSTLTYRSRYLAALKPLPVFDLVLMDPGNPRGLAFQLQQIEQRLQELPDRNPNPALDRVETMRTALQRAIRTIQAGGAIGLAEETAQSLTDYLAKAEADIMALSDALSRGYFSHTETPRPLWAVPVAN